MDRTWGSAYIYVVLRRYRANLGPKNVNSSFVQTCSKTLRNNFSRVITSPNAFLVRTGSDMSGLVGVDFGPHRPKPVRQPKPYLREVR